MPETFPSSYPSILPSKYIRCLYASSLLPYKYANDELIDLTQPPIREYGPQHKHYIEGLFTSGQTLACEITEMVAANINFDYSFRNTIPYYHKLP